jgi:hypothetical protein
MKSGVRAARETLTRQNTVRRRGPPLLALDSAFSFAAANGCEQFLHSGRIARIFRPFG